MAHILFFHTWSLNFVASLVRHYFFPHIFFLNLWQIYITPSTKNVTSAQYPLNAGLPGRSYHYSYNMYAHFSWYHYQQPALYAYQQPALYAYFYIYVRVHLCVYLQFLLMLFSLNAIKPCLHWNNDVNAAPQLNVA